jgi:pimeloyl-ACP methyl ester carboxylesterase
LLSTWIQAGTLACILTFTAGCTPSGFLARQLIRAPKTFSTVVAPHPRVYFAYPNDVTATFPEQRATVGHPALALAYRRVPPAPYESRLVLTNYASRGQLWPFYKFPARIPTQSLPSRGTVVLLHGYGLDHESLIPWALRLGEAGWTCILVDLRGHGRSDGTRITFGLQESLDLTALMEELVRRQQADWPVNVVGVSYGAAVALRWAGQEPRIRAVVAITPYDRLSAAVEGLRSTYATWVPPGLLRKATEQIPPLLGAPAHGLDPLVWLDDRPVRALFVAAGKDPVAPIPAVRRLAAQTPDSRCIELDDVTHELAPFRLDLLTDPVRDWLADPVQAARRHKENK